MRASTAGGNGRESRSSRFVKGSNIPKPPNVDGDGLWGLLNHPLNLLLIFLPCGIVAGYTGVGPVWTFWLNFLAMVPLAKIMGDATEELAAGLKNDMLAGLLNATFGNAVEMVLMVQTLRQGLLDVVKATLLGSVLSNMLLVLGCSFFFGGILGPAQKSQILRATTAGDLNRQSAFPRQSQGFALTQDSMQREESCTEMVTEKVQHFGVMGALVNTSLLLLSCLSSCLVTVFHETMPVDDEEAALTILPVSRICSVIFALAYCAYIFFQLFTHREAMAEGDGEGDDEEVAAISVTMATGVLCVTTCVIAFCSNLLVTSIEGVAEKAHMSMHFIGIVLLPIVGNACEHVSAVRFAIMDKPGLSIGIAIGSSTQISLFVVPFSVLMGWIIDQPMDLNFGPLNTTVMTLSVICVMSLVVDGSSNWLSGYLLMSAYCIVAVLYWYLPDELPDEV